MLLIMSACLLNLGEIQIFRRVSKQIIKLFKLLILNCYLHGYFYLGGMSYRDLYFQQQDNYLLFQNAIQLQRLEDERLRQVERLTLERQTINQRKTNNNNSKKQFLFNYVIYSIIWNSQQELIQEQQYEDDETTIWWWYYQ